MHNFQPSKKEVVVKMVLAGACAGALQLSAVVKAPFKILPHGKAGVAVDVVLIHPAVDEIGEGDFIALEHLFFYGRNEKHGANSQSTDQRDDRNSPQLVPEQGKSHKRNNRSHNAGAENPKKTGQNEQES